MPDYYASFIANFDTMNVNVKHIIFDLGGVILNIDYQRTSKAFQNLGVKNFDELYSQAKQTSLFDDFERGLISVDQFFDGINDLSGLKLTQSKMVNAWNAMLGNLPVDRIEFISELRCDKVLLSNTNEVHIEAFKKIIKDQGCYNLYSSAFDAMYYSSEIHMRKPDPETFLWVCEQHDFSAGDTLFIDDSIQHVEGAKQAGLQALHLDTNEQDVIALLNNYFSS